MTGIVQARSMQAFRQEAVRLARGGRSLSPVARGLGVVPVLATRLSPDGDGI